MTLPPLMQDDNVYDALEALSLSKIKIKKEKCCLPHMSSRHDQEKKKSVQNRSSIYLRNIMMLPPTTPG